MHVLTFENGIVKHYEYALDWIERKGFDWCLHSTISAGTRYWLVDDESWALSADIPAERLADVFDFTTDPDGVSLGRVGYEEATDAETEN